MIASNFYNLMKSMQIVLHEMTKLTCLLRNFMALQAQKSSRWELFLSDALFCKTARQKGMSSSKSIGGSLDGAAGADCCCGCGRDCAPPLN